MFPGPSVCMKGGLMSNVRVPESVSAELATVLTDSSVQNPGQKLDQDHLTCQDWNLCDRKKTWVNHFVLSNVISNHQLKILFSKNKNIVRGLTPNFFKANKIIQQ